MRMSRENSFSNVSKMKSDDRINIAINNLGYYHFLLKGILQINPFDNETKQEILVFLI
jgi:hypothetical protein